MTPSPDPVSDAHAVAAMLGGRVGPVSGPYLVLRFGPDGPDDPLPWSQAFDTRTPYWSRLVALACRMRWLEEQVRATRAVPPPVPVASPVEGWAPQTTGRIRRALRSVLCSWTPGPSYGLKTPVSTFVQCDPDFRFWLGGDQADAANIESIRRDFRELAEQFVTRPEMAGLEQLERAARTVLQAELATLRAKEGKP